MRSVLPNKERGVVMILILVFLTMFAIMISAFLFMTSSMSDSAANALALYEKGETAEERSAADVDSAIRTLVVGTNNEASPIGPFGILENLYGDQTTMEGYDYLAVRSFGLYAGYENGVPVRGFVDVYLEDQAADYSDRLLEQYQDRINNLMRFPSGNESRDSVLLDRLNRAFTELSGRPDEALNAVRARLLESGSTLSFGSIQWNGIPAENCDQTALEFQEMCRLFNEWVSGTSTQIIRKEIVGAGEVLRIEIALSEALKKFFSLAAPDETMSWPCNAYARGTFGLTANIRINPPAFSGTGAGGFEPDTALDGQIGAETAQRALFPPEGEETAAPARLPFALWGNAAAPDVTPYLDVNDKISFQTYWRHLADNEYRVYTGDPDRNILPAFGPAQTGGQTWLFAADAKVTPHDPVRMNPGYTAADEKNLFLGELRVSGGNETKATPSFARPETFAWLQTLLGAVDDEREDEIRNFPALLRKATPRPLRADHWNWTGGNDGILAGSPYGGMESPEQIKSVVLAELNDLTKGQWDVDNDNDGVKDGIWIPSGLPIRVDENGTPYATMYSFTVLDMDGRVNVNTAGNWEQMPDVRDPYTKINLLSQLPTSSDPNAPFYSFENLKDGIRWFDDADGEIADAARGTGLGPAGLNLADALAEMKINPENTYDGSEPGKRPDGEAASNTLGKRYYSNSFADLSEEKALPDPNGAPLFDGRDNVWMRAALRGQLAQPSAYYAEPGTAARTDPGQWILDDSDLHRQFYLHTDAVYRGNRTAPVADPNLFLFPWRGKTRVFDYGAAAGSPQYPKRYSWYPTFDFCDTALRSYDPLGNDILTYMPKYGENPYLVNPYGSTEKDATFTAEMLETLLRPFDYDRKGRDTALLGALLGDKKEDALNHPEKEKYRALRQEITTVSSDIPVPASAIPTGTAEVRDGVYGLRELIRRCVVLEIYKANREGRFGDTFTGNKKAQFAAETGVSTESEEGKALFRAYLRGQIEDEIAGFNSGALEKITGQLFALLPKEVQEGRRLDLNALSRKACWIDSVYEDQGDGTYVRTLPDGNADAATREEFEYYHQLGIAERMKFARGLYVLLMTLTYEDRNAETVYRFYDGDPDARLADEKVYRDYLEGYDKPYLDKITAAEGSGETVDEKKARIAAELTANRVAQYCVNLVDFSDPDAAMTPFFYDPNPFDGWWSYRDGNADWIHGNHEDVPDGGTPPEHQGNDNFGFVLFTAGNAERDFYDALIPGKDEDGNDDPTSFLSTPDETMSARCRACVNGDLPAAFAEDGDRYSLALVSWLNGQSVDHPGVGQDDFGMRLVWGMERPDLLLTETLNFHDLGIADTSSDTSGKSAYSGDDEDYDQVRRPLGSTYLELYCAANPNVPQPPELYEFDAERNLWKLELSKMTPRQKADSPYPGKEFPVWRVAISASTDPRGNEEKEKELKAGEESPAYKRTIRKTKNSAVERLAGDGTDPRTFSFRTRQFCDLTIDSSGEKSLDALLTDAWRGYDYAVSNLLGPCAEPSGDGTTNLADEVEIDRIVWFGWPTAPDGSGFDTIGSFPDAAHIFSRVKETTGDRLETGIFPNQYLVVAPAEKRAIGSLNKGDLTDYFGVPSSLKIALTNLREENSGKWTNSDFILAGTYNGLDINADDKFEVNKRGLNISEPLWTEATDPYPDTIPTKEITHEDEKITVTDLDARNTVPDHPFELPSDDHKNDRFPIAADHLLGMGTIPGIRSAFVQRVADPNRPYHPFANPYITVDWNMMDLTVFNGERVGLDNQTDTPFYPAKEDEINSENKILAPKSSFVSADKTAVKFDSDTLGDTSSVFSSRGWLDPEQEGFSPKDLTEKHRPNPWARPVSASGLQKDDKAGLRTVVSTSEIYSDLTDLYAKFDQDSLTVKQNVVRIFPQHTLGAYNDAENRVTDVDGQFDDGNLRRLYYGAPSRGSDDSFRPFEFLAWNDAPLSSPAELLLVPASAPGRFGLEFIRHKDVKDAEDGDGMKQASLTGEGSERENGGRLGRSLGSDGGAGANLFGWNSDGKNLTGPYLNFHHTSGIRGESLNLSTLFDYVTVPSFYMGTQIFAGYDENGDPVYTPTLREPGKINLNTMRESGWKGILGNAKDGTGKENVTKFDQFEGSRKTAFKPGSAAALNIDPDAGTKAESGEDEGEEEQPKPAAPGDVTLLRSGLLDQKRKNNNMLAATEELRKLSGLTTNRSNVFAVWLTVGYFKVERARPGVNMPAYDPDGNDLRTYVDPASGQPLVAGDGTERYLSLPTTYKYYHYYKAIYPDGYTYGKELGTEGVDSDGINRPRGFYLIDRSIPVDFRRGRSWNWENVILLQRKL